MMKIKSVVKTEYSCAVGSSAIIRYYCYIPCPSTLLQATACHIFHATSFDSIVYTAACYSYKELRENEHPHKLIELLWCVLLIILPIALVFSESSMNNIQSISIISAFPIGIIMIVMIMSFFKDLKTYIIEKNRDDEKANK